MYVVTPLEIYYGVVGFRVLLEELWSIAASQGGRFFHPKR